MKYLATAAILAALSLPTTVQADLVVKCFRGPWPETIWDKGRSEFHDSLTARGLSSVQAVALSDRICQDIDMVNNLDNPAVQEKIMAIVNAEENK